MWVTSFRLNAFATKSKSHNRWYDTVLYSDNDVSCITNQQRIELIRLKVVHFLFVALGNRHVHALTRTVV